MGRLDAARNTGKKAQEISRSQSGGGGVGKFTYGDYQDVEWLAKLEPGKKVEIDILPFPVTTDKHPDIVQLRKDWEGSEEILDHYVMYYQHRDLGPDEKTSIICPSTWGKPCPICEEREALMRGGRDWKDDEVKDLKKVGRTLMNVVSTSDPNKILLFDYSYAWFYENVEKKLRRIEDDKEQFWIADPSDKGRTLRCYPEPSSFNKSMAGEFKDIEFIAKKNTFEDSILDRVYKLDTMLKEYTYDEVLAIFNGDSVVKTSSSVEDSPPVKETQTDEVEKDEEISPEERRRLRREARTKKESSTEPVCPHGHKFGEDNCLKPECDTCKLADACEVKYEAMFPEDDIPF